MRVLRFHAMFSMSRGSAFETNEYSLHRYDANHKLRHHRTETLIQTVHSHYTISQRQLSIISFLTLILSNQSHAI